jgi:hypothetical protein
MWTNGAPFDWTQLPMQLLADAQSGAAGVNTSAALTVRASAATAGVRLVLAADGNDVARAPTWAAMVDAVALPAARKPQARLFTWQPLWVARRCSLAALRQGDFVTVDCRNSSINIDSRLTKPSSMDSAIQGQ